MQQADFEKMVEEVSAVITERNEQKAIAEKANARVAELDATIEEYQERMKA